MFLFLVFGLRFGITICDQSHRISFLPVTQRYLKADTSRINKKSGRSLNVNNKCVCHGDIQIIFHVFEQVSARYKSNIHFNTKNEFWEF